jgi:MoaA/NifB/PqqE/SkfB family radical SAM enzyme
MSDHLADREFAFNITLADNDLFQQQLATAARQGFASVRPYSVSLGIVSECGESHCGYCPNWLSSSHRVLSLDTIRAVLTDARALGARQVLFSGGEPLYHPRFFEALEIAAELGLEVLLITNGLLLTEASIDRLSEFRCKKIGISFDSLRDDRYLRIRGTARKPLAEAVTILAERLRADPQRFNVSLCMTLHRENADEILAVLDFARNHGFAAQYQPFQRSHDTPTPIHRRFWPTADQLDQIERDIQTVISLKKDGAPVASRVEYLEAIPEYFRSGNFWPAECYAAYAQITIDEHLRLRPCWAMDSVGTVSGETPLRQLWFADETQKARDLIADHRCPGCLYSCHLSKSYIPYGPVDSTER